MTAKKSKTPAVLGGCGCASLILSLVMFGVAFMMRDAGGGPTVSGDQQAPAGQQAADAAPAETPKQELAHYTNTPEGRTGNLAESYVGFEFDYPKTWIVKPQDSDSPNFVSVERQVGQNTCENFNVGYFKTAGDPEMNERIYPQLIELLQGQFSQQFPGLQKVREGKTKVGQYDAYEALFTATAPVQSDTIAVHTRTVLVPTPDGKKGVTIIMMGTSYCPDVKNADELGVRGELPIVLNSFRFTE